MASMFLGIYFNLSIWYKLTGQTSYGAYISVIGAVITVIINLAFVPTYGFMGSAWSHFISYFVMMVISFFLGQKHFKVPYRIWTIIGYMALAAGLFFISEWTKLSTMTGRMLLNTMYLLIFIGVTAWFERAVLKRILFKR
jgi:O-antigen/teichoic acid export membrane protein